MSYAKPLNYCHRTNGENHYVETIVHGIYKLQISQLHSLEVYAVTTGLPDSAKGPSSNNSDNAIKYTNTTISFARFEHFFIAIGKS